MYAAEEGDLDEIISLLDAEVDVLICDRYAYVHACMHVCMYL
jgi:hypothetical protein